MDLTVNELSIDVRLSSLIGFLMALHRTTAILVDFDGTLADSIAALKSTYFEFLTARSRQGSNEEFSELNGPSLKEIVARLSERHQLEGGHEELLAAYMELLETNYAAHVTPFETASAFLIGLSQRGLRAAMVTSTPQRFIKDFIKRFAWENHFEAVITGDEVTNSKPHPEIYLRALDRLKVSAPEAIAIEDSPNGVRSACSAGVRVIGLSAGSASDKSLIAAGAHEVVNGLDAVLRSIDGSV
jgi:beta-phosphoglucomutase-like phosphatase (HAD superfamily)